MSSYPPDSFRMLHIIANHEKVLNFLKNSEEVTMEARGNANSMVICHKLDEQLFSQIGSRFCALFIFVTPAQDTDDDLLHGDYSIAKTIAANQGGKISKLKYTSEHDPEIIEDVKNWLKECYF